MVIHYVTEENNNEDVLRVLLIAYPKAVRKRCSQGWLPVHYAALSTQNAAVLRILLMAYPDTALLPTSRGGRNATALCC